MVGVGVVLEELGHVGHDGFLVGLVHIHVWGGKQKKVSNRKESLTVKGELISESMN